MKLEQSFTVSAPVADVWAALTDVLRVAPCLPGANITEDAGDGTFKGEFKVKIGPTTAAYVGALKMEHLDQEAHVATMSAKGTDKRGNGGTTATIISSVTADPDTGETRVDVDTDFSITGKLARFGRGGMIQDVSNRLLREFAANLRDELAGAGAPAPENAPQPGVPRPTAAATADVAAPADVPAAAAAPPPLRLPRPPAEPLDGGGLVVDVLVERLKGALPAFAAGVVVGVLVARR